MIRLQEMLVSEIVGKSMVKEETLRDYISRKAEWYIPTTEAITLKLAGNGGSKVIAYDEYVMSQERVRKLAPMAKDVRYALTQELFPE